MHKFLVGCGAIAIMFGLVMALGVIGISIDPKYEYGPVELVLMGIFFCGLPIGGGSLLIWKLLKHSKKSSGEQEERQILKLASERGGRLTAAEIAVHTQMDSKQAQAFLEDFHRRGLAEMQVSDSGVIIFAFPGLLSPEEKGTARGYES